MNERNNVDVVNSYLSAQKKSDQATIQGLLSQDVTWSGGLIGAVSGAKAVCQLLDKITGAVEFERSEVKDIIAQRDKVVVLGNERLRAKDSGKTINNAYAMVFTLANGKITACELYEDTAAGKLILE